MNLEGFFDFVEVSPWFWIVAAGSSVIVFSAALVYGALKMAGRGQ